MYKHFIKDLVRYFPARIVPGIVGLISIPIITRLFSPVDYGNYNLALATIMVLTTIVGWLSMGVIRFFPAYERDEKINLFYRNIISLSIISIIIIASIYLVILFCIKSYVFFKLYNLLLVSIGVFAFTSLFEICLSFFRAKREANLFSLFSIWKSIGSILIALALIFFLKKDIESLLWGVIASVIIALPFVWKKAVGIVSVLHFKIDSYLTKEIVKYGFPLVIGNLAGWILSLSDRYILQFFRGAQEVGIYSASYNISEKSIVLIVLLFMFAGFPISMHIWEKEGEVESQEFLTNVTRYFLIICLPVVIGLSVLSKQIIILFTAQEYHEGFRIISFVTLGAFFLGLQHRFQMGLLFYKKTYLVMFCVIVSGVLNIALNLIFIPTYGYIAAAVTTLISYGLLLILVIFISTRFFVWKFPFKTLGKVICASALMGEVVYYISNNLTSSIYISLFLSICTGGAVFFLVLLLLKEFLPEEIQMLYLLKQKVLR